MVVIQLAISCHFQVRGAPRRAEKVVRACGTWSVSSGGGDRSARERWGDWLGGFPSMEVPPNHPQSSSIVMVFKESTACLDGVFHSHGGTSIAGLFF